MKNIFEILNNFILQTQSGDLKTSSYPKDWNDLRIMFEIAYKKLNGD